MYKEISTINKNVPILNKDTLPDKDLVSVISGGDDSAFSYLMNRHIKGLTLFIEELLKNKLKKSDLIFENAEEAKDIAQEAFEKAYIYIHTYNNKYEFSTWLYNIAKNITIDYLRKRRIILCSINNNNFVKFCNIVENSPEDNLIYNQKLNSLIKNINSLSKKYREPAKLRFIKEYAYSEISEELDIDINTVKTRIKRAKELILKNKLD